MKGGRRRTHTQGRQLGRMQGREQADPEREENDPDERRPAWRQEDASALEPSSSGTSSIKETAALSPGRGPSFVIRVYPPARSS